MTDGASTELHEIDQTLGLRLLEHSHLIWESEREVADRDSHRLRLLVTVSLSLLGALLVGTITALSKLENVSWDPWARFVAGLLLLAPVAWSSYYLLKVSLLLLLSNRYHSWAKSSRWKELLSDAERTSEGLPAFVATSSYHLLLPDEYADTVMDVVESSVATICAQTLKAAEDLRSRNLKQRHRIRAGERALGFAVRMMFVSIVVLLALLVAALW